MTLYGKFLMTNFQLGQPVVSDGELHVGLCLDSQRIQLKSLYITKNFTGLDGEF